LSATVDASGAESVSADTVTVLVTLTGHKNADTAAKSTTTIERLEITTTRVGGRWLAALFATVGIQ
jgi:hypothetical protein